ncbi:DNA-processing protein DprA [Hyphococcus sp.]|uniref:DNA-processing protein DprA n=1 Tax=Hyphococcus sp. TaxID=2038636 RepID=UPI002081AA9C|nr:MAG: DNA processing protein DprA [Marinicaulis sp.]
MPDQALSGKERLDWLQLIRTQNIGPVTFHRLMAKFGSAANALAALPDLARKAGRSAPFRAANRNECEQELKEAERHGARLIAACEDEYPNALKAIPDHPPVLYIRGHASLFEKPAIAIIGARNASGVGRKIARMLASDLGAAGYVVTSGLARGIDGAAHDAALASGTIAVVAGGVDVIYPPEHDELTERIAREGAVISECPMGAQPTARDFPKRNRLISGLSHGVVVVEAAAKSGTLLTANFALEQGREVFAVPGSPLDPRCQGANRLIRDGACLVETAQDIIDALAAQNRNAREGERVLFDWSNGMSERDSDPTALLSLRRLIKELLSFTPLHRDEILREVDAPPGLIADVLLDLVLSGEAQEHEGGRFSLRAE